MLCTVTDAALHDLAVAVSRVPLSSETFSCGTLSVSFAFRGEKGLNLWLGEPETFSSFEFGTSLPFALGSFKRAPEAANRAPGEAPPVALGAAILVVHVLMGLLLSHPLDAWYCHGGIQLTFIR